MKLKVFAGSILSACALMAHSLGPFLKTAEPAGAEKTITEFAQPCPDASEENALEEITPQLHFEGITRFTPEPLRNASSLIFGNGIEFDTRSLGKDGEPDLDKTLMVSYGEEEYGYYVVQFQGPLNERHVEQLEASGVEVFFYVRNYGFVCGMANQAEVDLVQAQGDVNWIGAYHPAYKISERVMREPGEFTATILLFDNADIAKTASDIKDLTRSYDKVGISDNGINKIIRIRVKQKDIAGIACMKEVYWIEPWHQEVLDNQGSQWCVQHGTADSVRTIWHKDICGQGQIMALCDTGIRPTHYFHDWPDWDPTNWYYNASHPQIVAQQPSGREAATLNGWPLNATSRWGDEQDNSYHGTHVGCSVSGWDAPKGGTSPHDGMSYQGRLYFLDGGGDSGAVFLPGDLNNLYYWPYESLFTGIPRVYSMTNSWGDSTANGGYDAECMETDQFCWSHKDFLIFFSNGNDGTFSGIGHRSGSPASSKNVLAVGALSHPGSSSGGANSLASFSSRGQTADGRYKPDLAAPGVNIVSADGRRDTWTTIKSGTSMASPIAAGASLMARQYLKEGWYPTGTKLAADSFPYISAALMTAMLMHSEAIFSGIPDTLIGWGRVNLDTFLYFSGDQMRLVLTDNTTGVLTGEDAVYKVYIPTTGASELRISLAWTDYPSTPASFGVINDLDLLAVSPGMPPFTYKGNMWTGSNSTPNPGGRDAVNVRESIRLSSLPAGGNGNWTIIVRGQNVVYGPQPFALVVTYRHASITAGRVTLNKPVYRSNDFFVDTVRIRVEDNNFGSAGAVDQVPVRLVSNMIETQPETVWCTELAANSYVFEGKAPLLFHKAVHGDGKLSIAQGDTITAIYTDANPAYTSQMKAAVDAEYFVISDVHVDLSNYVNANVQWTTSEQSGQKVYYGLDPEDLNNVVTIDTPLVFDHSVYLGGLVEDTIYYFDVESKDYRNNVVKDNNDGRHYAFTTQSMPDADILVALLDGDDKTTVWGSPLPDLRERFKTAIESGGWSWAWWETSDHDGYLPPRNELKKYKAIFVPNEDEYPPFLKTQQETIKVYEEYGGRIAFSAHDFLWHAWDNSSDKLYDTSWCKNYCHGRYVSDITLTGTYPIYGVSGDPISGDYYSTPVDYAAHRSGAAADELEGVPNPPNGWDTGTADDVWRWQTAGGMIIGTRWTSTSTHGTPGDGVWGGHETRTILSSFSATQMDNSELPEILNKQFIWLIGHDHPDVTANTPIAGNTYTTSPISISWTPTTYGGSSVDTTWLDYSSDGGSSWHLIYKHENLSSPYSWNLGTLQNHYKYRVRVRINDKDVYPSLKSSDATGMFTIKRTTGDTLGPMVLRNSIEVAANPKIVTATDITLPFTAVLSDSETGLSNIGRVIFKVTWNGGGTGTYGMWPTDGAYDEIREIADGSIKFSYTPGTTRICTLWVRCADNTGSKAENWGQWYFRTFTLIDGGVIGVGAKEDESDVPLAYALHQAFPNPTTGKVLIAYALPQARDVHLKVYDCTGRLVRTLVSENQSPGYYSVFWNGKDDVGRRISAGVYFYQFITEDFDDTKKLIFVR